MTYSENPRAKELVQRITAQLKERKPGIYCGSPFGMKISGNVSAKGKGKPPLAALTECNVHGDFTVVDSETKESASETIDFSKISHIEISACPGDIVQATITTYDGNTASCPVSSLDVTFDESWTSDFNIKKYWKDV